MQSRESSQKKKEFISNICAENQYVLHNHPTISLQLTNFQIEILHKNKYINILIS